jgi:prophage antirepressor-like protein
MAENLSLFNFRGHPVRVVPLHGLSWFVGADAVGVLGLVAPAYAYSRLNVDEKTYVGRTHLGLNPGKPMTLISESGLYKLIMRSDKPEAREFQDWVTRVVLPAIRTRCDKMSRQSL